MPRSLADPLYERLLDSFPAVRAYTRADWEDDAMPPPVAHFLGQLMHHYSRREARHLRRARSKWVDYDHPEMESAVRTFFDAVESHTRVPADEWEDTLHQATRHTTAHLVRPVHVLTDFVYAERKKALRLPEILWRMNFFGPYAYLREAIHAFAKKRDLDTLLPDRFEHFLHQVDERITANYDADRWVRLLNPLFATVRRATGREQVSVPLVQAFFAEKGRTDIEQRLQTYADEGHRSVAPRALHRLIEEADEPPAPESSPTPTERPSTGSQREPDDSPSSPQFPPEPSETPTEDEIWGVAGAARPEGSGSSQPSQQETDDEPLWKQFQQGRTNSASTSSEPSTSEGGGGSVEKEGRQEPLWARFRHDRDERLSDAVSEPASSSSQSRSAPGDSSPQYTSSSSAGAGQSDLEALELDALGVSNPPHRAVYVRQLFGGDQTNYRRVLKRLSNADSWGRASQIIASEIFRAHKVNIYSDAAVHFTNAVEQRFRE